MPASSPIEVLTGFVSADGDAYGRPVGVALDRNGALLVAVRRRQRRLARDRFVGGALAR